MFADQASHLEHRYLGLAKDFLELGVGVDIAFVGSVLEFVLFDVNPHLADHLGPRQRGGTDHSG